MILPDTVIQFRLYDRQNRLCAGLTLEDDIQHTSFRVLNNKTANNERTGETTIASSGIYYKWLNEELFVINPLRMVLKGSLFSDEKNAKLGFVYRDSNNILRVKK
ncbi:MAG: hypothetical protein LUD02_02590 [Tannerellaceae bacterium]|nr:hypothetical protein [Tannerellaceae bacterium]